ncbi:MAG: hypothetical protein DRQ42_10045 [Gammaproteobacteria bacterium]|nr:MAG: hypothetical protein DRQ42_10045 [Gammaproteobacteria bacterium]
METVITCPLGSACEEIKDNKAHRCAWFIEMSGVDAQGNDHNSSKCAMAWMPILQVEMSGTNRGQTAAIESLRNETVKRQNIAIDSMRRLDVN